MALRDAAKECIYLQNMLNFLNSKVNLVSNVNKNNSSYNTTNTTNSSNTTTYSSREENRSENNVPTPIIIGDSSSAQLLAENPEFHKRSKHIDLCYHFIRHHITNGAILMTWVPSKENLADPFTKAVPFDQFQQFLFNLRLIGNK
jgi:hypothetical protein